MERFYKKVKEMPSGCHEWQNAKANGYGVINIGGKRKYAHRLAWSWENGDIPDGLFVCHTCDNRACVNPKHLFLGSHGDNVRDMWAKGRGVNPSARGEDNPASKITQKQANHVKELLSSVKRYPSGMAVHGELIRVSKETGVPHGTVNQISLGNVWNNNGIYMYRKG